MTILAPRAFDRVLVIMFENQYRGYALHNPYLQKLAKQGIELTNYHGVMHPSQTNYVASIAGELCNVTYDASVYKQTPDKQPLPQRTIVDLLEEAGLSWKAYMQGFNPSQQQWTPDLVPADNYPYMLKHNPFGSFEKIVRCEKRWNCIVDEYEFWSDVVRGQLPHYGWYTPNMWNDGHWVAGSRVGSADPRAPQLVDQMAGWLESLFAALQFPGPNSKLPPKTLVVVTFDEAEYINPPPPQSSDGSESKSVHGPNYSGPNQIYTVLLGDGIQSGKINEGFNHYSLLKTIERNFGLSSLGKNDVASNSFDFLWGQSFQWGTPEATPIQTSGPLAAAACQDQLCVVSAGNQSQLQSQCWDGQQWSAPQDVGVTSNGGLALTSTSTGLMLVFQSSDQSLSTMTHSPQAGWSKSPQKVVNQAVGTFAVSELDTNRLMLVYQDATQQIQSLVFANGSWAASPVAVGQQTDGSLTLTQFGSSLILIFKALGSDEMHVVTYNTADFNVVTIPAGKTNGPYNNTTQESWSPSAFSVAQFELHQPPAPVSEPKSNPKLSPEQLAKFETKIEDQLTPEQIADLESELALKRLPEPTPVSVPSTGSGPLVSAVLDGVLHLAHPDASNSQVIDETFSVNGVMTSKLPTASNANDPTVTPPPKTNPPSTSNGFGTLAQASWNAPTSITGACQAASRGMALARVGSQLILVFQSDTSGQVQMVSGQVGYRINQTAQLQKQEPRLPDAQLL